MCTDMPVCVCVGCVYVHIKSPDIPGDLPEYSKINQISRSPAFDLQSPGKESVFFNAYFSIIRAIGAKYKQKWPEITYLAFSFTNIFRGGGCVIPRTS